MAVISRYLLPTQLFLIYLPEMWQNNPHCSVQEFVSPKLDITHHWTESQRENQSNWNAWRQNNYQENVKRSDQNTQEVYQEVESSKYSHQNARRWSWNNFDSRGGLHSLKFSKEFAKIPPWTETTIRLRGEMRILCEAQLNFASHFTVRVPESLARGRA